MDRWLLTEPGRAIPLLLLLTEADRCCLWMNNEHCWGVWMNSSRWGLDEQDAMVLPLDEHDPDRSSRLGVDEKDPVEGWMNMTPWREG